MLIRWFELMQGNRKLMHSMRFHHLIHRKVKRGEPEYCYILYNSLESVLNLPSD